MNEKNFRKEYFSIPNIMGYFRIFLVGVYMVAFYRAMDGEPYWPVVVTIIVSGLTDFFDGKIARRFDMVTEWGKMLDPIADKITIGAIILSLSLKYKAMIVLVVFYIIKEGFMAIAGLYLVGKGHRIEGAKWYGKVCTFGTYIILLALLLFLEMPAWLVNVCIIANLAIMAFTLYNYVIYYSKILDKQKEIV